MIVKGDGDAGAPGEVGHGEVALRDEAAEETALIPFGRECPDREVQIGPLSIGRLGSTRRLFQRPRNRRLTAISVGPAGAKPATWHNLGVRNT